MGETMIEKALSQMSYGSGALMCQEQNIAVMRIPLSLEDVNCFLLLSIDERLVVILSERTIIGVRFQLLEYWLALQSLAPN